ncbi:adenylate kinase [Acetobacteroides hydrogenigenes]|uniref:Adenylate kinase n=1 Tax=Acetobacteroides hydrogenigenes TaxID=979970 RepID=A0A4R2ESW1_9BACT|nr:adenylate kinase [Acetobacteroides hydrogenigenes]TCN70542.1 adenylate kinase [Acetobacteroides hydrogenigenes]
MINIALFGAPGAGKGTQSEHLIKKYKLHYISTGDLLRQELKAGTKIGLEAKNIIAEGGLVSDEIIVQIIEKTIKQNPDANGFLFDGFPRTYVQGYILEGLMINLNTSLNCLINIEVSEEVSTQRLLGRAKEQSRSDDNEVVIRKRLREYQEKTLPVLDFFRERGICKSVNGEQPIDTITHDIELIVNEEMSKQMLNVLIMGYPGAGRGSLGLALAKKYGLEHLSTGKMLEEEIKNGTEVGVKVKELFENGQMAPDDIVVPLIEKKIKACKNSKGFVFTGFPRTLVQSYILEGVLKKHGMKISHFIELEVPTLELVRRLDARSKTDRCMPYDTTTQKIIQRLIDHETKTIPVLERYRQRHEVSVIDGTGTREEVADRAYNDIENRFKHLR